MLINAIGRNYFFATRSKFEAFVGDQQAKSSVKAVGQAIFEEFGDNIPDEGIVIFEYTNDLGKQPPKEPKAPKFQMQSRRKLGARAKAAADEATVPETPVEEKPETGTRRTRKIATE